MVKRAFFLKLTGLLTAAALLLSAISNVSGAAFREDPPSTPTPPMESIPQDPGPLPTQTPEPVKPVPSGPVKWEGELNLELTAEEASQPGAYEFRQAQLNAAVGRLQALNVQAAVEANLLDDGGTVFVLKLSGNHEMSQINQALWVEMMPEISLLSVPLAVEFSGKVKAGEEVELTLQGQPSTGNLWEVTGVDGELLTKPEMSATSAGWPGGPDLETFRMQALKDGVAKVSLLYHMPWEERGALGRLSFSTENLVDIAKLASPVPAVAPLPIEPPVQVLPSPDEVKGDESIQAVVSARNDIPPSWDWRSTNQVTGVRNQSLPHSCGSCWAHSTVGTMEHAMVVQAGKSTSTNLSEQYLISCNSSGYNCGGGLTAHEYHRNGGTFVTPQTEAGAVLETDFPYSGTNGTCTTAYTHANKLLSWAYVSGDSYIKTAIMHYGAVAAWVCADNWSALYKNDGVAGHIWPVWTQDNSCSSSSNGTNHEVTVVGWSDAGQYWIAKNSWGTGFGHSGYIYIHYGIINVEDHMSYVVYQQPVVNDDFNAATTVSLLTNTFSSRRYTDAATSATDDPSYTCVSGRKYNTVWYKFTPNFTGTVVIETEDSDYDTVLGVYQGSRGALTSRACDDDAGTGLNSWLKLDVTSGQTYYIDVASYGGRPGVVNFKVHRLTSTSKWSSNFGYNTANGGWDPAKFPRVLADVNGDGKDDVVGFGYYGVTVALSNGSGFVNDSLWFAGMGYNAGGWRVEKHPRTAADVNGDGKADLIGFGENAVVVALSNGTKFLPATVWASGFATYGGGWRVEKHPRVVADVNGDGKADIIGFGELYVYVALSDGTKFGTPAIWYTGFTYASGGWRVEKHVRTVADVNGDGKADLIGFGESTVFLALSNGSSFLAATMPTSKFTWYGGSWQVSLHPRTAADWNGDGRADLIGFGDINTQVSLSLGSTFSTSTSIVANQFAYHVPDWVTTKHIRTAADVDGDGRAELVGFYNDGVYVGQ